MNNGNQAKCQLRTLLLMVLGLTCSLSSLAHQKGQYVPGAVWLESRGFLSASAGIYVCQPQPQLLGRCLEKLQCGRRPGQGKLFLLAGGERLLLRSTQEDSRGPVYFDGNGKFGE